MNLNNACFALATAVAIAACDFETDESRVVGQLESDRVEIRSEVFEPIVEIAVAEGQRVSTGDLLLRQDDRRILAGIREAKAALAQNQARLDELVRGPRKEQIDAGRASVDGAKRELEFRQTEYGRAQQVFERELASPDRLDRAKAALERHQPQAPVDGLVDSRLFELGEQPAIGQPMLILLSGAQPYARIYIPEPLRVRVGPGTKARVYVDGLTEPLAGTVRWVSSEAAFTPYFALTEHDRGRLTFFAKVDILGTGDRLPDGVPVEVELVLDTGGR